MCLREECPADITPLSQGSFCNDPSIHNRPNSTLEHPCSTRSNQLKPTRTLILFLSSFIIAALVSLVRPAASLFSAARLSK